MSKRHVRLRVRGGNEEDHDAPAAGGAHATLEGGRLIPTKRTVQHVNERVSVLVEHKVLQGQGEQGEEGG